MRICVKSCCVFLFYSIVVGRACEASLPLFPFKPPPIIVLYFVYTYHHCSKVLQIVLYSVYTYQHCSKVLQIVLYSVYSYYCSKVFQFVLYSVYRSFLQ